jgi:hypothetical protein
MSLSDNRKTFLDPSPRKQRGRVSQWFRRAYNRLWWRKKKKITVAVRPVQFIQILNNPYKRETDG